VRLAILCALLLVAGCDDDNPTMKSRLGDGQAMVVMDEQGNRYVVTHADSKIYHVVPIDSSFRERAK
jgi:hypothetical protein